MEVFKHQKIPEEVTSGSYNYRENLSSVSAKNSNKSNFIQLSKLKRLPNVARNTSIHFSLSLDLD